MGNNESQDLDENEPHPAPAIEAANRTTDPSEEELYRLRVEFYKTQAVHGVQTMYRSSLEIQSRNALICARVNFCLILIDSGDGKSFCGEAWIAQWYGEQKYPFGQKRTEMSICGWPP